MLNFFRKKTEPEKPKKRVYVRNYNAGKTDLLTQGWATQPMPFNQAIQNNLQAMRARSREQSANNDYVRKFIKTVKSNVIGPKGITLQVDVRNRNNTRDPLASQAIEEAWRDWSRKKHCDVAGLVSFVDMQRLLMASMITDGEFFCKKIRGNSAGKYGYQLQALDPELLDVTYNEDLPNGNYIYMSIEYNSNGKPVAYHLLDRSYDSNVNQEFKRKRIRVRAEEIIHIFIPENVQQLSLIHISEPTRQPATSRMPSAA